MRSFFSLKHGPNHTGYYRTEREKLIERLSNWQRRQWGRAGAPMDEDSLRRFARLQRDGTELYRGDILPPDRKPAT